MIPEPLQDRPLITLGACYAGPESEGAELIQPIRELGEPVMDTFQTMPPSGLPAVHMEPDEPVPGLVYTASLREAPQEAIDSFIETAGLIIRSQEDVDVRVPGVRVGFFPEVNEPRHLPIHGDGEFLHLPLRRQRPAFRGRIPPARYVGCAPKRPEPVSVLYPQRLEHEPLAL
jgi:hypothetical protein